MWSCSCSLPPPFQKKVGGGAYSRLRLRGRRFLATKLVYVIFPPVTYLEVVIVSCPRPPKKHVSSCSSFLPPPPKKSCEVVVVLRGSGAYSRLRLGGKLSGHKILVHGKLTIISRADLQSSSNIPPLTYYYPTLKLSSFPAPAHVKL